MISSATARSVLTSKDFTKDSTSWNTPDGLLTITYAYGTPDGIGMCVLIADHAGKLSVLDTSTAGVESVIGARQAVEAAMRLLYGPAIGE